MPCKRIAISIAQGLEVKPFKRPVQAQHLRIAARLFQDMQRQASRAVQRRLLDRSQMLQQLGHYPCRQTRELFLQVAHLYREYFTLLVEARKQL